ncbi:hypothetical protein GCM10023194_48190 [Planotetraspora phitsanulokensis]|uniref:DUF6745 domain-containing protein n=1 Tax=Planotetraspora phitsanulokensis TaxID=575192 RepID=A0A8J3UB83_9ACTN|nr:hypothetical protein [Planotetraspora phitsanulokensis]GII42193.1 hypothetical protein Pph01_71960 [Planotetraspora phitsanulokensis]
MTATLSSPPGPGTRPGDSGSRSWEETALATGPADRPAAEEGVRQAYWDAGLPQPERIVWLGSPLRGAVAALLLGDPAHGEALVRAGLGGLAEEVLLQLEASGLMPTSAADSPTGRAVPGSAADTVTGQAPGSADGPAADSLTGRAVNASAAAGASVRTAVRTLPWERARAAVHASLAPAGWAQAWADSGGLLWQPVNRTISDIRHRMSEMGGETAGELLRGATLDAVFGQHDAAWLSVFDPVSGVRPGVAEAERAALGGLAAVARAAGWWWPFERIVLVCERPSEAHRDDAGRLHRAEGPAMSFPDGFALHSWRGMPVPAGFGASMASLDAERIRAEENAELRRVMLEHYGYERYLKESNASPMHRDETGTLWRLALPDDEDLVMVQVVNSTPEPDGTRRTYFLRVPPSISRAREGVAWTFGVPEADYRPEKET